MYLLHGRLLLKSMSRHPLPIEAIVNSYVFDKKTQPSLIVKRENVNFVVAFFSTYHH